MILLSPYLQSVLFIEGILLVLMCAGLISAVHISLHFNPAATTALQFALNKKSYLVATIIKFTLTVKLFLFLFFIWTMDSLSAVVPGAMCAAGIVSATQWGVGMLGLKITILFGLFGWLVLHVKDMSEPTYPFTKLKFTVFQPLFMLIALEFALEIAHFSQIQTDIPVQCCSLLFTQNTNAPVSLFENEIVLLGFFYGFFLLTCTMGTLKYPRLFGLSALMLMFSTIYTLIRFFSSYVYELPTHKCPFCLLQGDYYYVGYLIYLLLFVGTASALGTTLLSLLKRKIDPLWYQISLITLSLLVTLLSAYPLVYFIRNGVWL